MFATIKGISMLIEKLVSLCLQQEEILASKELPLPYYKRVQKIVLLLEKYRSSSLLCYRVNSREKTMAEYYYSKIRELKPTIRLCHRCFPKCFSLLQNTSGGLLLEVVSEGILKK